MFAGPEQPPDIPQKVRAAFAARAQLTLPELAAAIEVDERTLRRYCDAGVIEYLRKGLGARRTHRLFTLAQVEAYYRRISSRGDAPCPSTGTGSRHSGNSISNAVVYAFPDRRASQKIGRDGKPKRSRRPSLGRPSVLSPN